MLTLLAHGFFTTTSKDYVVLIVSDVPVNST